MARASFGAKTPRRHATRSRVWFFDVQTKIWGKKKNEKHLLILYGCSARSLDDLRNCDGTGKRRGSSTKTETGIERGKETATEKTRTGIFLPRDRNRDRVDNKHLACNFFSKCCGCLLHLISNVKPRTSFRCVLKSCRFRGFQDSLKRRRFFSHMHGLSLSKVQVFQIQSLRRKTWPGDLIAEGTSLQMILSSIEPYKGIDSDHKRGTDKWGGQTVDVLGDRKNLFGSSGHLYIESSYRWPCMGVRRSVCSPALVCGLFVYTTWYYMKDIEHTDNKLSLRPLASFPLVFLQTVPRVGALEM